MRVFEKLIGLCLLLSVLAVAQVFANRQSIDGVASAGAAKPDVAARPANTDPPPPQQGIIILYPYSLSFGRVMLGKATDPQPVTVRNNGTGPLKISSIAVTGDFTQTNNCPMAPATVAVDANCGIQVTFRPSALGNHSGTLTVNDDSPGSPHTVELIGAGTTGSPRAQTTPDALTFPEQPLGGSSQPETVNVTNAGTEPLIITGISVEGDFTILPTSTCETLTGNLDPGAQCTIQVSFTPLQSGKRDGFVVITDNAANSPQKIALTGSGKELTF